MTAGKRSLAVEGLLSLRGHLVVQKYAHTHFLKSANYIHPVSLLPDFEQYRKKKKNASLFHRDLRTQSFFKCRFQDVRSRNTNTGVMYVHFPCGSVPSRCCLCVFAELSELQQLSRDPGLSVLEGAWTQVLEETLHVPASLRPLLLY